MHVDEKTIVLAIPIYNCETEIIAVLKDVESSKLKIDEIWIIDNKSTDNSVNQVKIFLESRKFPYTVLLFQNEKNLGFGGSHKIIFQKLIDSKFNSVAVLHGDYQARAKDLVQMISTRNSINDSILGARFMSNSVRSNYPKSRVLWNYFFNTLISLRYRRKIHDLGSGLNIYSKHFVTKLHYQSLPNDLTFNIELLKRMISLDTPLNWSPISWISENQKSNVKVVSQTLKTFKLIVGGTTKEISPLTEPLILGKF